MNPDPPSALPPKPQAPVDYDCCGGGCADCELRIYLRELQRWQKQARQLGIPAERVTVIPPGTDFDRFQPADGDTIRNPRTDSSYVPVILHVGRLKKYKSTDHLLRAARILKDRGRSFRVVIIGAGDDLERLKQLSFRLRLGDTVEFTGFVSEDEKLAWYRRSAVLVENSVKEGWGLIVMEANACGTPAIVARSPGLVDSSRDGVNGLMYDYGDVSGLAEQLDRLLTDEPLRARLGQQAIGWARQWTWDGAADSMEQIITGAVAGRSSP